MAINRSVVQKGGFTENREEFDRTGLTVVRGLYKPSLARAVADETFDLTLFTRPRILDGRHALGQEATLHPSSDLRNTVIGIALHQIVEAGSLLGMPLRSANGALNPITQAVEAKSTYKFEPISIGHSAVALAILEGEMNIGREDHEQTAVTPGAVAFVSSSPELGGVLAEMMPDSTVLLVAGS